MASDNLSAFSQEDWEDLESALAHDTLDYELDRDLKWFGFPFYSPPQRYATSRKPFSLSCGGINLAHAFLILHDIGFYSKKTLPLAWFVLPMVSSRGGSWFRVTKRSDGFSRYFNKPKGSPSRICVYTSRMELPLHSALLEIPWPPAKLPRLHPSLTPCKSRFFPVSGKADNTTSVGDSKGAWVIFFQEGRNQK